LLINEKLEVKDMAINGTAWDDTLIGTDDRYEEIYGYGGNDYIDGKTSSNYMNGGPGDDTIVGGTRGDSRSPFSDVNTVAFDTSENPVRVRLGVEQDGQIVGVATGDGTDTILNGDHFRLSDFNDSYFVKPEWHGGQWLNSVFYLNDLLSSRVYGYGKNPAGFNMVSPGPGDDTITGNFNTRISYADNRIKSSKGIKVTFTGEASGNVQGEDLNGIGFTDTFTNLYQIRGTTGPDELIGSAGTQIFQPFGSSSGYDIFDGGPDTDYLDLWVGAQEAVTVDLGRTDSQKLNASLGSIKISSIEMVRATPFNDSLLGDASDNYFVPMEGDDTIDGGGGIDSVVFNDLRQYFSIEKNSESGTVKVIDTRPDIPSYNSGLLEYRFGSSLLTNVEFLVFEDETLSVDQDSSSQTPSEEDAVTPPQSVIDTHSIDVIVDLLGNALHLKGLIESTDTDSHTIAYNGSVFNYADIDPIITIVTRDGEFTDEFRNEIAEIYPGVSGIRYSDALSLLGQALLDSTVINIAGADGNYVG
jgi:Ca2+-binding RTX toxin-like protein